MNSAALQPPNWNRHRWLILFPLIFLAQVALIYFLGNRGESPAAVSISKASVQLFTQPITETQFSETFLADDPTLFAAANLHGFSGEAWLKIPRRNYDLSEQIEAPFWLALNPQQLGNSLAQFVRTNALAPVPIVESAAPKVFASPILDLSENAKTNSQFHIEGDLVSRRLIEWPELKPWANSEILSNTVAQIAVNQGGVVVAARLLSRSGLPEADRAGLALARELRFAPSGKADAMWGKLIFDWQTVPTVTENSTNGSPRPNDK
jgi:hypothetical protein